MRKQMSPMKSMLSVSLLLLMAGTASPVRVNAQPDGTSSQAPVAKASIPVKIDLTLTRTQGEKKLSSMPYSVLLLVNDQQTGGRGSVRIGFDVPTGSQTSTTSQQGVTTSRADYRNIGIQIDFNVSTFDDTRYRVGVNLTDSSIYSADADSRTLPRAIDPVAFRTFSTQGVVLLRDGQSSQVLSATDKITAETLRADVTLTVVK